MILPDIQPDIFVGAAWKADTQRLAWEHPEPHRTTLNSGHKHMSAELPKAQIAGVATCPLHHLPANGGAHDFRRMVAAAKP